MRTRRMASALAAGQRQLHAQAAEERPLAQPLGAGAVGHEAPADVLEPGDRVAVRDHVVGEQAHGASRESGRSSPGTPQLGASGMRAALDRQPVGARQPAHHRQRQHRLHEARCRTTTPVTSSQPGIGAVLARDVHAQAGRARARRRRSRPGARRSGPPGGPRSHALAPAPAAGRRAPQRARRGSRCARRATAPGRRRRPAPRTGSAGTLRSCSSGCGLRRSAMTLAPASSALAHSLTDAIPAPMTR